MNDPLHSSTSEYIDSTGIAMHYDRVFDDNALFELDTEILDRAFTEPAALLDLGCGTGRHTLHFARQGFSVTGVDLSVHMLDVARKKIRSEQLMVRLVQGDIRKLDFLQEGFFRYAVCMFSTLGMIKGKEVRQDFMNQVFGLLKPGGVFVFHVHNRFANLHYADGLWWFIRNWTIDRITGRDLGDRYLSEYRGIKNMYLHNFSDGELRKMIHRSGFEIQQVCYLNWKRDGLLRPCFLRGLRSNGFIAVARKP